MRKIGDQAEKIAQDYLVKNKFKIVKTNLLYKFGEIDIIAKKNKILIFVEVKYRKNNLFGEPYLGVTLAKQKKIIKAAQAYLQKLIFVPECRFDVISICGCLENKNNLNIEHIEDAFELGESYGY